MNKIIRNKYFGLSTLIGSFLSLYFIQDILPFLKGTGISLELTILLALTWVALFIIVSAIIGYALSKLSITKR